MKIIKPSFEILTEISNDGTKELKFIEKIGRVCYKSENKITDDGESAKKFVAMLIKRGHEAMIEHSTLTVKFICDRGISHELVRHRLCSFAQESTRYCNYSGDKFGNELTFISPILNGKDFDDENNKISAWYECMQIVEDAYFEILANGSKSEAARAVLPNSLKTEIIVTANYREWRNIFKLRTARNAHPKMRELMIPLLKELKNKIPIVFDDIEVSE